MGININSLVLYSRKLFHFILRSVWGGYSVLQLGWQCCGSEGEDVEEEEEHGEI